MKDSSIEWTDHTFNPVIGCTKVSPACDFCYAEVSTPARAMKIIWGVSEARHRTAASTWAQPLAWNRAHDKFFALHGRRQRVFCASLADVFDNQWDPAWRADLLMLIRSTPNLDWQLLTKRVGNVLPLLLEAEELLKTQDRLDGWDWLHDWTCGSPPPNVWLGATVVNQEEADRDIPKLLATPARVRFLSMEPLLGPVSLVPHFASRDGFGPDGQFSDRSGLCGRLHWIIAGGESGPGARPSQLEWYRSLRDQCAAAGVAFLFKQWGEFGPSQYDVPGTVPWPMQRVGKKAAGHLLDGIEHNGFPS